MSTKVLLTQCIQRDYLLNEDDRSIPGIYIGQHESRRIMGGPLLHVLRFARNRSAKGQLHIVHVRDCHQRERDAAHLAKFGEHCLQGTRGAELVCGDPDDQSSEMEHMVDAPSLNDWRDTRLPELLEEIRESGGGGQLRVGVVGCWTECKVLFNCYELSSTPNTSVATASCLTAGASIEAHHSALRMINHLFDAKVFNGATELLQWLLEDETVATDIEDAALQPHPVIHRTKESPLSDLDLRLLQLLYADCESITLKELSGGFSGASVQYVESVDLEGRSQMPTVAKIGDRGPMAKERVACEKVELLMGEYAPRVYAYTERQGRAGIKFAYAGGLTSLTSLRDLAKDCSEKSTNRVSELLQKLFSKVLLRLYQSPKFKDLSLFEFLQFDGKGWAYGQGGSDTPERVRERIERLLPDQGDKERLTFSNGSEVRSVAEFCENDVKRLVELSSDAKNLVSFQHADLHGDNVLLSDTGNVVVIDYGYSREGPVLMDATKLETDFFFEVTKLETQAELLEAMALSEHLYGIQDIGIELQLEPPKGVRSRKLVHLWTLVRVLRRTGVSKVVGNHRSSFPLHLLLLRYCLHALTFSHYSEYNLKWVLFSACLLAEDIRQRNRFQDSHYQLYSLRKEFRGDVPGEISMGALPGRLDRDWSTDDAFSVINDVGISLIVVLVDYEVLQELTGMTLSQYEDKITSYGIKCLLYPLHSGSPPSFEMMKTIFENVTNEARADRNSLICSANGLGRSGVALACIAKRLAPIYSNSEIINHVAEIRGDTRIISSEAQKALFDSF